MVEVSEKLNIIGLRVKVDFAEKFIKSAKDHFNDEI